MIKPITRKPSNASSAAILRKRIRYIEDKKHPDHAKVSVYKATNYRCSNATGKAFEKACISSNEAYQKSKERRLGGRKTMRLFEEFIYSTPKGANLTEAERESTELMLVNEFSPHSACRVAWHSNAETGRSDLHLLIASKSDDYPPVLTIWNKFGGSGKKNIITAINRLSKDIINKLNKTRAKDKKLKSAQQVYRDILETDKDIKSLAEELAELKLAPAELREGLETLGYEITRENEETVSVKFPGSLKAKRYNKANLFRDIAEIPLDSIDMPAPKVTALPKTEKPKKEKPKKEKPKTEKPKKDEPPPV
jgi:hypothetical protein